MVGMVGVFAGYRRNVILFVVKVFGNSRELVLI